MGSPSASLTNPAIDVILNPKGGEKVKKYKYLFAMIFAACYAFFLSLGTECLFSALGSVTGTVMGGHFSHLYWFSLVLGILCAVAVVVIFIFNFKVADRCGYKKHIWWIQAIISLMLAFFMVEWWETLFVLLQETF